MKIKDHLNKAKETVKEFWTEHGEAVKFGVFCGVLGIAYGSHMNCKLFLERGTWSSNVEPDEEDDFEYNESNTDDPDLLELIRSEQSSEETV